MRYAELCAGYGGLSLAIEEAFPGAELAWYSEFDPAPSKIMARHWPGVPNHGDMTKIQWVPKCPNGEGHRVEVFRMGANTDDDSETFYRCMGCGWELPVEMRPEGVPYPVDLISGGTPCQDLSHAGRRKGMTKGTRSNLWVAMRESIAVIKPTWVVWENVRGAYSAEADSDLEHCPGCMGDTGDRGPVLRALGRVLGDLHDLGFDAEWRGLRAADVGAPHGRFRVFVLAKRRA
jgi:DNA (cytosine-5)-methyltransferase 1